MKRILTSFVILFLVVFACIPARSDIPNIIQNFNISATSGTSNALTLNGQSTCYVSLRGNTTSTVFSITPQASDVNGSTWNTVYTIGNGNITTQGVFSGNIASSGIGKFRIQVNSNNGYLIGSIGCSATTGAGILPVPVTVTMAPGASGPVVLQSFPGQLINGVITTAGTSGTVTFYDNASACSGKVIANVAGATALSLNVVGSWPYLWNMPFANGLTACGGTGSAGLTISMYPQLSTVLAYSTPAPAPTPTATATPSGNVLPWVYSQIYSSNSPFHRTVAQLKSSGATVIASSSTIMNNLWNQGIGSEDISTSSYMPPVYVSAGTDPVKVISCTGYGPCDANGMSIHVPANALPEPHSDAHIAIIDPTLNVEFDGWQCAIGTTLNCTSGGIYQYTTNHTFGLKNNGWEANHGGVAYGLGVVTAQELVNGHIDHALLLNTQCLNNPTLYPMDLSNGGTDQACTGITKEANPAAQYGQLVHFLKSPTDLIPYGISNECKTILNALYVYGAYTYDTGAQGISIAVQSQLSYSALGYTGAANPWNLIINHMITGGDVTSYTYFASCFQLFHASDFELLQIPTGSYL